MPRIIKCLISQVLSKHDEMRRMYYKDGIKYKTYKPFYNKEGCFYLAIKLHECYDFLCLLTICNHFCTELYLTKYNNINEYTFYTYLRSED